MLLGLKVDPLVSTGEHWVFKPCLPAKTDDEWNLAKRKNPCSVDRW